MLAIFLDFFSNYLIECMTGLLFLGLIFRWASYISSKKDNIYFSSFASEIEKILSHKANTDPDAFKQDNFLDVLFEEVTDKLPTRTVRQKKQRERSKQQQEKSPKDPAQRLGAKNVVTLREYVTGEKSLFHSIKSESGFFDSKHPPNFHLLTERILDKDTTWNRLVGILPIGPILRLNDVLPGLFVVFGIFGTFIGIAMALPEIANINFNNLEASGEVLTNFVLSVTFAMKTSIAGILFSLIMTLLNTLAPVRGLRSKTFKRVSNCFENIWHAKHSKRSMEEEIADTLPAILLEIQEIRKASNRKAS